MKLASCLAAAFMLTAAPKQIIPSVALKSGDDLWAECTGSGSEELSNCSGYVAGVADTLAMMYTLGVTGVACPPMKATVSQLVDIVVNELRNRPEVRQYSAASTIAVALKRAFPCQ
jgi:Rap1a immunity proteins